MLTVMGVSIKWSHCLSLKEFEKWGIKMLNGDSATADGLIYNEGREGSD